MTGSTKLSDKPSPPVTRYPLFKSLAVASCTGSDAATFMIVGLLPNQRIATPVLAVWLDRLH
jgi:hypothetical protein